MKKQFTSSISVFRTTFATGRESCRESACPPCSAGSGRAGPAGPAPPGSGSAAPLWRGRTARTVSHGSTKRCIDSFNLLEKGYLPMCTGWIPAEPELAGRGYPGQPADRPARPAGQQHLPAQARLPHIHARQRFSTGHALRPRPRECQSFSESTDEYDFYDRQFDHCSPTLQWRVVGPGGAELGVGDLCGDNTGQHLYISVGGAGGGAGPASIRIITQVIQT